MSAFKLDSLRIRRLGEIEPGNLIAVNRGSGYAFAIAARGPNEWGNHPAAIGFNVELSHGRILPAYLYADLHGHYCLDYGVRASFAWSAAPDDLHHQPQPGYISISKTGVSLCVQHGAWPRIATGFWDLATAALIDHSLQFEDLHIARWSFGLSDWEGDYKPLYSFTGSRES